MLVECAWGSIKQLTVLALVLNFREVRGSLLKLGVHLEGAKPTLNGRHN